jgi:MFS family permease
MIVGFSALQTLDAQTTAVGYVLRFLPVGVGMGIFQSPNNSAVMGAVPRARLGVASGLLSMTRTLGQTSGIAVLGALWASRVALYDPGIRQAGVTTASTSAQVAALHDVFFVVLILLALGAALSIWGLVQERRMQRVAVIQVNPSGE